MGLKQSVERNRKATGAIGIICNNHRENRLPQADVILPSMRIRQKPFTINLPTVTACVIVGRYTLVKAKQWMPISGATIYCPIGIIVFSSLYRYYKAPRDNRGASLDYKPRRQKNQTSVHGSILNFRSRYGSISSTVAILKSNSSDSPRFIPRASIDARC